MTFTQEYLRVGKPTLGRFGSHKDEVYGCLSGASTHTQSECLKLELKVEVWPETPPRA